MSPPSHSLSLSLSLSVSLSLSLSISLRLCLVCGQEGEGEAHFVFNCKAHTDIGKKYSIFDSPTTHCGMNHVSALLTSKNETEITALAKYITEAMKVREKKIENN